MSALKNGTDLPSGGDAAQVDALVLGLAPAVAASAVYTSLAQSMGILFENAVAAQNRQTLLGDLAVLGGLAGGGAVAETVAAARSSDPDPVSELKALLDALKSSH